MASMQRRLWKALGSWYGSNCERHGPLVLEALQHHPASVFLTNSWPMAFCIHRVINVPTGFVHFQPQTATSAYPHHSADVYKSFDSAAPPLLAAGQVSIDAQETHKETYRDIGASHGFCRCGSGSCLTNGPHLARGVATVLCRPVVMIERHEYRGVVPARMHVLFGWCQEAPLSTSEAQLIVSRRLCQCARAVSVLVQPTMISCSMLAERLIFEGSRAGVHALLAHAASTQGAPAPEPVTQAAMAWPPQPGDEAHGAATGVIINAYSPTLIPTPADYAPAGLIHTPGCWAQDAADICSQMPSAAPAAVFEPWSELSMFLSHAPQPPVFVGFGSMVHPGAKIVTPKLIHALMEYDSRGHFVLQTGAGNLSESAVPADAAAWAAKHVLFIGAVPHCWLLPRCRAAVHHGGAGTMHAAALAAVPQVVLPLAADQFLMGHVVHAASIGTRTEHGLASSDLSAAEVTAALRRVDSDSVRERAREVANALAAEDGRGAALCLLLELAGTSTPP